MREGSRALTAWAMSLAMLSAGASAWAAAPESIRPDDLAEAALAGPSPTTQVADWVTASGDNHGAPFAIIDKATATVFVYDRRGGLQGAAPALIGVAPGDDSVPGIGERPLSSLLEEEKTTPAGRFVISFGRDLKGAPVLWIDYQTAISIHPVVTTNRKEQRQVRLDSPSPEDNRITYGCINVPMAFYEEVVHPAFAEGKGVFYILPEEKPLEAVFPGFRGQAQPAVLSAAGPAE
jgi:hypothetical protein